MSKIFKLIAVCSLVLCLVLTVGCGKGGKDDDVVTIPLESEGLPQAVIGEDDGTGGIVVEEEVTIGSGSSVNNKEEQDKDQDKGQDKDQDEDDDKNGSSSSSGTSSSNGTQNSSGTSSTEENTNSTESPVDPEGYKNDAGWIK